MWLLLLLSCLTHGQTHGQRFYLVDEDGRTTNNGLLIADRIGSHKVGSVCDDEFNSTTATVICRDMDYNNSVSFSSADGPDWSIKQDYEIVLDDVMCIHPDDKFVSCSYVVHTDCDIKFNEQVFLECSCSNDSYMSHDYTGCRTCPPGAVGVSPSNDQECVCERGTYWSRDSCVDCAPNTYKPNTTSGCVPCPTYSTSSPGAVVCECEAGYRWEGGGCRRCGADTVSVRGSTACARCPHGSVPVSGNTACSCPAGHHWNTTHCTTCTSNTYSIANGTRCTRCPVSTVALPGSSHCVGCPQGTAWVNYTCPNCNEIEHDQCPRCPLGYTQRGKLCMEDKEPQEHKEESGSVVPVVVLAALLGVFFILTIVLVVRLLRGRGGSKAPNTYQTIPPPPPPPSVLPPTYNNETYSSTTPEPTYALPTYSTLQQDIPTDGAEYVQSDRAGGDASEYVETDNNAQYSVFCGNTQLEQNNNDNIYDNI